MHDRPNAEELVRAVIDFLEQELLPTVSDQRLRFRGLVANHVLLIVARELAAGDTSLHSEHKQLLALLGHPEHAPAGDPVGTTVVQLSRELSAQIRNGEYDGEEAWAAALAFARESVIAKLQVANPRALS